MRSWAAAVALYVVGTLGCHSAPVGSDDPSGVRAACANGQPLSCFRLGVRYEHGAGVERDLARARALFEKVCESGVPDGCIHLGVVEARAAGERTRAQASFKRACDLAFGASSRAEVSFAEEPEAARAGAGVPVESWAMNRTALFGCMDHAVLVADGRELAGMCRAGFEPACAREQVVTKDAKAQLDALEEPPLPH